LQHSAKFAANALHPAQRRASHVFQSTPHRRFADLPQPPRTPITFAAWLECAPDVHSLVFLDSLARSRAPEANFHATLKDIQAANALLFREVSSDSRLGRSTTYDALRYDIIMLDSGPADGPLRQAMLDDLFQRLVALMTSHAPELLTPRRMWTTVIRSEAQSLAAREACDELAVYQLRGGQTLSLSSVRPDDLETLTAFLTSLSPDSYAARFPRCQGRLDRLATHMILDAQHPNPSNRHTSFVLHDELQRVVGLVDYHERDDSMMKEAVHAARAGGQPLPKLGLKTCEFNVVIADAVQGQGLGQPLLEFAMAHAGAAGYVQMVAVVSDGNPSMLKCLAKMGSSAGTKVCDPGYRLYVLNPQHVAA
jgi:RimJ/RimL family protein N-acetyltransferase